MIPFDAVGSADRRSFANHASMMMVLIGTPGNTGHRLIPPPDTAFPPPILPPLSFSDRKRGQKVFCHPCFDDDGLDRHSRKHRASVDSSPRYCIPSSYLAAAVFN